MKASVILELLKLLEQPDILPFAGGIPDPAFFPAQAFAEAMSEALTGPAARQALQYAPSKGHLPLRGWLAGKMAAIGIPFSTESILITSGSQQALDYFGKLLLGADDTALVGFPTYLGAMGAFNAYEPRYARLDLQANTPAGDIQAEAAPGRARLAYVVPDFANPTGASLTQAERARLLDLADEMDIAVIEDAAYQALLYDRAPLPRFLRRKSPARGTSRPAAPFNAGRFPRPWPPGCGWAGSWRHRLSSANLY